MSRFFITNVGLSGMICAESNKRLHYTNGTTLTQSLTAGLSITKSANNFIPNNIKKTIIISDTETTKQIEAEPFGRDVIVKIKDNGENDSMWIRLDRYDSIDLIRLIQIAIDNTSDE